MLGGVILTARNSHSQSRRLVTRSADGATNWSPVEMAMHYTGPLITCASPMQVERDGQRRFLLPAHRNTLGSDARGSRDHFILSSTSLLEWKLEAYIPQPTAARVFLHEGNLAVGDAPGDLKLVMRTANYDQEELTTDPPRAYSSVSRDGGRTWSAAREEPDLHNAKSKVSSVALRTARTSTFTTTARRNASRRQAFHTAAACRCVTRSNSPAARGVRKGPSTTPGQELLPYSCRGSAGRVSLCLGQRHAGTARTHIHFGKLTLKP